MKTITINRKQDLLEHRLAIEDLFFESFGQRVIGNIWDWAYLSNPNGEPIVTLCYEADRLVGHYAIVPMPLSLGASRKQSFISMTTMVAESHRKFGLFTQLAQETYRIAAECGVDFVFGFPNQQSVSGFRNRLKWTLPESDYVAAIDKGRLLELAKGGHFNKRGLIGLDLNDPVIRAWRLSRPGADYSFEQGLAFKRHQDGVDLLWWETPDALASLPDASTINVLVSASAGLEANRQFDYQFGGIGLGANFDPTSIIREMAISDLF